jgi:hypothetical protein
MKSTVQFYISHEAEGYTAEGVGLGIVTQADSLDALMANIQEAVQLHFDGETVADLGYTRQPSIMINYELIELSHA